MPKSKNCQHGHGGYAPGPVYICETYLSDGTIMTSCPMSGRRANALARLMRKRLGTLWCGSGSRYIGPGAARESLLEAARSWRDSALSVEQHLAPEHLGFEHAAARNLAHADKLEQLARSLAN